MNAARSRNSSLGNSVPAHKSGTGRGSCNVTARRKMASRRAQLPVRRQLACRSAGRPNWLQLESAAAATIPANRRGSEIALPPGELAALLKAASGF